MRIAVTGPESSGKTTLSQQLAQALNAPCIPEYARDYLTELKRPYIFTDLVEIANGQVKNWQQFADTDTLICDTEMLVLKVWSEFKFGKLDAYISEQLEQQEFDLYLLCTPDLPWEEDPLREHPEQRVELFAIYLTELKQRNLPFVVIEGQNEERLQQALTAIENRISDLSK
jgi:NadR type nicotinamide-nucleotide adenylyltransferase